MKHFTMEELTRSVTARVRCIPNDPTPEHRENIERAVAQLFDPLRESWAVACANRKWGTPALFVSSGYRSEQLNRAVGGSATSAHCAGYAFDLVPENGRISEFKTHCRDWLADKAFDQMISEEEDVDGVPRWIHLGYKGPQGRQRRQLLSMQGEKYTTMTL